MSKSIFHLLLILPGQVACGALMFQMEPLRFDLLERFGITNTQSGLLLSQFIIGQMISSFFAASISRRIGLRMTYLLGAAIAMLAAGLLIVSTDFKIMAGLRFVLGFGIGIQFVMGGAYIFLFCQPSSRALCQGIFGACFNLGSGAIFLFSQIGTSVDRWTLVRFAPPVLLAFSTMAFAAFADTAAKTSGSAPPHYFGLLRRRPLLALSVAMFGSWGTFVVLGHWLSAYLVTAFAAHLGSSTIATGVILLFSAFGRAAGGAITPFNQERSFILLFLVIATAAGIVMWLAGASSGAVAMVSVAAIVMITTSSMCFGPILAMIPRYFDGAERDAAISVVLAMAMALTTAIAPVLGAFLDGGAQRAEISSLLVVAIPFVATIFSLLL